MKNLFKFVCLVAFLLGGLAFSQTKTPPKKADVKVVYCKKFTVSLSIGVVSVETELTGCLVTVNNLPIIVWLRQGQNQDRLEYLYVEENEMMSALKIEDPKELENLKLLQSGIWDYEGVKYVLNPLVKYEIVELEGIKYYALPIQEAE